MEDPHEEHKTKSGTIVFRENVCDFNGDTAKGTVVHLTAQDTYPLQSFVFENNILPGLPRRSANRNFFSDYAVANWQADNNVYSQGIYFERLGALFTLLNWQNSFGVDLHSIECNAAVAGNHLTGFAVTFPPRARGTYRLLRHRSDETTLSPRGSVENNIKTATCIARLSLRGWAVAC